MMNKPAGGVDVLGGYFTCYDDGRIWSNKSNMFVGSEHRSGYIEVSCGKKRYKAHRLIANAFFGMELDSILTVDHLNGIKTDNRVSNLEVVTQSENVRRACQKHFDDLQSIVDSVTRTKSWATSARELGYSSNSALMYRYEVLSGVPHKELSTRLGIDTSEKLISADLVRRMPLNDLVEAIRKSGGQRRFADSRGLSQSTISKILKEKRGGYLVLSYSISNLVL